MFIKHKNYTFRQIISLIILICFSASSVISPAQAQTIANLPKVGNMVPLSELFVPALIKGISLNPENPLNFDFIIDTGFTHLQGEELKEESTKLIKYFLAALTVPEEELWVNLSPYEGNRIVPESFGITEMGRDLLAQDYLLKQLTATLMYPEEDLGKAFWKRVQEKAYEKYGTSEIPMNTFNKIWIVPHSATIFEKDNGAYIIKSRLKVLMEEDYMALQNNMGNAAYGLEKLGLDEAKSSSNVSTEIVKEILIPEIEKEVNEGRNFAPLRQIYQALILASWYKANLKESFLGQIYLDRNKVKGVDIEDKDSKYKIYQQYVEAFKQGVYNYIKEDYDPTTHTIIPRKYFSGGFALRGPDNIDLASLTTKINPEIIDQMSSSDRAEISFGLTETGTLVNANVSFVDIPPNTPEKNVLEALSFPSDRATIISDADQLISFLNDKVGANISIQNNGQVIIDEFDPEKLRTNLGLILLIERGKNKDFISERIQAIARRVYSQAIVKLTGDNPSSGEQVMKEAEQQYQNLLSNTSVAADSATILVVEDEETLSFPLEFSLEKEGHQIVVVRTVEEAIDKLQEPGTSFDFVFTDRDLSGANGKLTGTDLIREQSANFPDTQFILTTADARSDRELRQDSNKPELPIIRKPYVINELKKRFADTPSTDSASLNQRTILLVDSERLRRQNTINILKIGGYRVLSASTLDEAIVKIEEADQAHSPVDLVLTERELPMINGIDLANVIRNSKGNKIPILIKTSLLQEANDPMGIMPKNTRLIISSSADQLLEIVHQRMPKSLKENLQLTFSDSRPLPQRIRSFLVLSTLALGAISILPILDQLIEYSSEGTYFRTEFKTGETLSGLQPLNRQKTSFKGIKSDGTSFTLDIFRGAKRNLSSINGNGYGLGIKVSGLQPEPIWLENVGAVNWSGQFGLFVSIYDPELESHIRFLNLGNGFSDQLSDQAQLVNFTLSRDLTLEELKEKLPLEKDNWYAFESASAFILSGDQMSDNTPIPSGTNFSLYVDQNHYREDDAIEGIHITLISTIPSLKNLIQPASDILREFTPVSFLELPQIESPEIESTIGKLAALRAALTEIFPGSIQVRPTINDANLSAEKILGNNMQNPEESGSSDRAEVTIQITNGNTSLDELAQQLGLSDLQKAQIVSQEIKLSNNNLKPFNQPLSRGRTYSYTDPSNTANSEQTFDGLRITKIKLTEEEKNTSGKTPIPDVFLGPNAVSTIQGDRIIAELQTSFENLKVSIQNLDSAQIDKERSESNALAALAIVRGADVNEVQKIMKQSDALPKVPAEKDSAQMTDKENVGGIDLNPAMIQLKIKRDGNGIPLPIVQQPSGVMNIDGFVPVIINVTPMNNLPLILGIASPDNIESESINLTKHQMQEKYSNN